MSLSLKSSHKIVLPYDSVNIIFEYLSQLLDKKWKLVIDNKGVAHLRFNRCFGPMASVRSHFGRASQMTAFNYGGRYVTLTIRQEPSNIVFQVQALQQFRALHSPETDQQMPNLEIGMCYSYTHPETNQCEVAYVDKRCIENDPAQVTLLRGTLFRGAGRNQTTYAIYSHIVLADGSVDITAQNWTLDWLGEEELDAIDGMIAMAVGVDPLNLGAYFEEAHFEEDMDEEIDYDNLPQLQMYM